MHELCCKAKVSYYISSFSCLTAEVDQPLQLIRRIVGFQFTAIASHAQRQNGLAAHTAKEDVVNPAPDQRTVKCSQTSLIKRTETKTVSI